MKKFILLTELTFSKIPSPHTKGQRLSSFFLTLVICLLQFSYVSAQNYQWAKAIGSTYTDYGNSIAVDDTGNVYITGDFQSTADFNPGTGIANLTPVGYKDIFIAKYAPNGNYLWAKNIGSTYIAIGYSIAVDGTGNCYITGIFYGTADFDPGTGTVNLTSVGSWDIFFAKYDANGNYLWAKNIGSTDDDEGYSIAVDGTGNVYITGYFIGTTDFDPGAEIASLTPVGSNNIFFAKYDANGNYLWAKSIGGTSSNHGSSIAIDGTGNCYITGYFRGTTDFDPGAGTANLTPVDSSDIFFARYDVNGNYLWAKSIGSTSMDFGISIAVDSIGNCYITGFFRVTTDFDPGTGTVNLTSIGNWDIFFAKYDANGNYLWAKNIGSSYGDGGYSIAVDDTGNIYLTGYFQSTADFNPGAGTANLTSVGYKDIFFAKYGQSAMGINENIIVESINIYPNPANNNIVFEGLQEGKIELINLQGQVIRNIEITETKTSIDLSKLSSGIYLIKLSTGKSIITKKFVKQ